MHTSRIKLSSLHLLQFPLASNSNINLSCTRSQQRPHPRPRRRIGMGGAVGEKNQNPHQMDVAVDADWDRLDADSAEAVLSRLPISTLAQCSAVCRPWRLALSDRRFVAGALSPKRRRTPWFFLFGQNNVSTKTNKALGFDPEARRWISLDTPGLAAVAGAGGLVFAETASASCARLAYAPVLKSHVAASWRITAPMRFSRRQPLVGVLDGVSPGLRRGVVVVGGVRFVGGLVDIEDRLAVEIYDTKSDNWELCAPLPSDFRTGNSSQWLSSALLGEHFFVLGIYSGYLSAFDLRRRRWGCVRTVRPPGVVFAFAIACHGALLLAGLCCTDEGPVFKLFALEDAGESEGECNLPRLRVVGCRPREILLSLFDGDDEDKFASLKCVGGGGLVYVFNEDPHRMYRACVCEISALFECRWSQLPAIPQPFQCFHKVVCFCSPITPDCVLSSEP